MFSSAYVITCFVGNVRGSREVSQSEVGRESRDSDAQSTSN